MNKPNKAWDFLENFKLFYVFDLIIYIVWENLYIIFFLSLI